MQNENAKEFASLFFCFNLCLRFNSISPAGQRYAGPIPPLRIRSVCAAQHLAVVGLGQIMKGSH